MQGEKVHYVLRQKWNSNMWKRPCKSPIKWQYSCFQSPMGLRRYYTPKPYVANLNVFLFVSGMVCWAHKRVDPKTIKVRPYGL